MRPRSVPAPIVLYEQPMLYKDHSIMDSMYIPNNPQYGLQLEYTTTTYPANHSHSQQQNLHPSSSSPSTAAAGGVPGPGGNYRQNSVILPSYISSNYNLNGVGPSLTPIATVFNPQTTSPIAINACDPTSHHDSENLTSPCLATTPNHHHHHQHQPLTTPGDPLNTDPSGAVNNCGASDVLVSDDVLCCSNCGTGQLCCAVNTGSGTDPHHHPHPHQLCQTNCDGTNIIEDSGGGGGGGGGAHAGGHHPLDCCDETGNNVVVSDITLTAGTNHNNENVYNISGIVNNNNVVAGSIVGGGGAGSTAATNYNSGVYTNSTGTTSGTSYWATDVDMGTFSLPPLDLDPLPSLFPFSPCSGNNFKSECVSGSTQAPIGVKQPHDMADVLLSLKHAVVHPGQTSSSSGGGAAPLSPPNFAAAAAYPQQSQLSYTMHPHQMLMSPTTYSTGFCDQGGMFAPTNGGCQNHQPSGPSPMFPSMSVNVSMNMTMHGYPPPYPESIQHQVTCPQMQWSTSPQNTSPVYHQQSQGGILSPGYPGGATYSFTADFRTPAGESPLITTTSSFKPVLNKSPFSQLAAGLRSRRQSLGYSPLSPVGGAKVQPGSLSSEDESQRPNLCRICGKTYARPSTLKTHLRTHSGEKPYRCGDCNKSFSQAANLTAHVRTHSGEKPFRCPICDRRFSQSSSVTTHMRTHSGERPYRCRMCKKAFSDSSTLTKHLRIHSGEKPYQCKLCLLRFSQSGNLNRHMRVHGTNNQILG